MELLAFYHNIQQFIQIWQFWSGHPNIIMTDVRNER